MVKLSRIEEGKKIQSIEENLELTRKGLDMIKLGRMKETAYYNQQLKEIEERIDRTRKNLQQTGVKRAETETAGGPVATGAVGYRETPADIPAPIIPVMAGNDFKSIPRDPDPGYSAADPPDEYQPVTPNRIVFVTVIVIVFVVLILTYFNFFK